MIGLVAIDEQESVRLTTNLVDVEPEDVRDRHGGRGGLRAARRRLPPAVPPGPTEDRRRELTRRASPLERRAVISGIGQSAVGRHLGRTDIDLTVEACLAAVADAGLTRDDIDGLATYPGMGAGTAGFAGPSTPEVQDALRLRLNWHDGGGEGPGQMRALIAACLAVGAGLARHVLVYRTVSESTAQGSGGRQGIGGGGGGGGGAPVLGLPAVVAPLRRGVGGELAGPGGRAPDARVLA